MMISSLPHEEDIYTNKQRRKIHSATFKQYVYLNDSAALIKDDLSIFFPDCSV